MCTDEQELFTPKDRLDYRYFYKRGYYLGIVKAGLVKAAKAEGGMNGASITWDSQDERRPVIAITVGKGTFLFLHYGDKKLTYQNKDLNTA